MGKSPNMSSRQRRAKAMQQANNAAWRDRAIRAGISKELLDLRAKVCGSPTNEINFIVGQHAGEEGDLGDPIPKCARLLKLGRPTKPKHKHKHKPKRKKKKKKEEEEEEDFLTQLLDTPLHITLGDNIADLPDLLSLDTYGV